MATSFKPDQNRKCCFCGIAQPRNAMCTVPTNSTTRQEYGKLLGSVFLKNAEAQSQPYLCLSHFPPAKKASPQKKTLPYPDGVPAVRKAKSGSNVFKNEKDLQDSDESEEYDEEYIDNDSSTLVPELQHRRVLCDWESILPYIRRCERCLKNGLLVDAVPSIRIQGLAVLVSKLQNFIQHILAQIDFSCKTCSSTWKWASSQIHEDKTGKTGRKTYKVNTDMAGATVISGNGFSEVQALSNLLDIPFFSEKAYYRIVKSKVRPIIDEFYQVQQEKVMQRMVESINSDKPLHIAGDGQFDSRGYCAKICRFTIICVHTGFVLDFEVCRKGREGGSVLLEKLGHEITLARLLEQLKQRADPGKKLVEVFTSDRCNNMAAVMKNYPDIEHTYDNWHWVRSIRKDLNEKYNYNYFEPMIPWIRPLFAHIRTSISTANGDGELAWEMIFSFFHHVFGVHKNFEPIEGCHFTQYNECGHKRKRSNKKKYLDSSNPLHVRAVGAVQKILLKGNRKEDLKSVSPSFSTHSVESFHAVATKYTTKEKYFEKPSFVMRSKLSVMHWNNLKFDEEQGKRPVVREVKTWCKSKKTVILKKRKAQPCHEWRHDLMNALRSDNRTHHITLDSDTESESESSDEDLDDEEARIREEVERMLYQF